eukprot:4587110-Amphidinium_carterae.1
MTRSTSGVHGGDVIRPFSSSVCGVELDDALGPPDHEVPLSATLHAQRGGFERCQLAQLMGPHSQPVTTHRYAQHESLFKSCKQHARDNIRHWQRNLT